MSGGPQARRPRLRDRLPGLDAPLARDQPSGPFDDRDIDHPAVQLERRAAFGLRLLRRLDDAHGMRHVARPRPVLLVDDGDLPRMHAARAVETELPRSRDHGPEPVPIGKIGHGADVTQRHDAGGARRQDHALLGHQQRLVGGLETAVQGEILATYVDGRHARRRAGDVGHLLERLRRLDHDQEARAPHGQAAVRLQFGHQFVQ